MEKLSTKIYKNEFVSFFPGDDSGNIQPRLTPGMLYSKALPTPVSNPRLLAWSEDLAKYLKVQFPDDTDVKILGGNLVTDSMYPYAACYAGHQFGSWAGQLGDGRAITLGEWVTENGSWELQLKGAGPTAYSRRADGRAVLRSSLREYLMSEAMHYLNVPTTRALSLVSTGDPVLRDMFYDGNAAYEPGAIVMRVAPTFLRFGSFEMPAARKEFGNLEKLIGWTIDKFYPHIQGVGEQKITNWFQEVVEKTAALIIEWLRVGFVHGVMNTDNMSILGLTIDYGPFSFVDDYDPNFTPNTTDLPGRRYAFGRQGSIAYWNLGCLANALAALYENTDPLAQALESFQDLYAEKYYTMMGNKLGLDKVYAEDLKLIADFEHMLTKIKPDMTIFYQLLMNLQEEASDKESVVEHFQDSFYQALKEQETELLYKEISAYQERVRQNKTSQEQRLKVMQQNNPRFILRNYLLHQAITDLEAGDGGLFQKLQEAIKFPYSSKFDEFFEKRPEWATQKAGCSMLSCSS